METLELLEKLLAAYKGTLLLVSHDRSFLNNVVTSTMVFEDNGKIGEYPKGYDDWRIQRSEISVQKPEAQKPSEKKKATHKLSNKKREELKNLPKQIKQLEKKQENLHQTMSDPSFYQKTPAEIQKATAQAEVIPEELEKSFER